MGRVCAQVRVYLNHRVVAGRVAFLAVVGRDVGKGVVWEVIRGTSVDEQPPFLTLNLQSEPTSAISGSVMLSSMSEARRGAAR